MAAFVANQGGEDPIAPEITETTLSVAMPIADDPGSATVVDSFDEPALLGTLDDISLDESSGLVASRSNPGLFWTHNDSGGRPALYCLDAEARSCGVWEVDAETIDWEDMSAGPGPEPNQTYLYIGDIGDNERARANVTVYRALEPAVSGGGSEPQRLIPQVEALVLRYPDGPHDAEALLVHPEHGDLYLVTKERSGSAGVYRAAGPLAPAAEVTLERVASLDLPSRTADPPPLVTGGDIAPDGRHVALSTYGAGVELALGDSEGNFDEIWDRPLELVALPQREQGEAIAYRLDGAALLVTSEGHPMPLYELVREDR